MRLFELLRGHGHVIVAYSGGTDSAYLAWAAHRALGDRAIAITADSASIPASHKRDAEAFVQHVRHRRIATSRRSSSTIRITSATIRTGASTARMNCSRAWKPTPPIHGLSNIVYGVNKDDLGDYRPGQKAAKQHSVKAPLVDAELSKAEIRELSRLAGLPTWDRPAAACLSSRIPYGTPVTLQNVKTVEVGEEELKALGFRQFRTRFHGELVRIEIAREEMARALDPEMAATLQRASSASWATST